MCRLRLDVLLVEKGLAKTRPQARDLILSGKVIVNGSVVKKPSAKTSIKENLGIEEISLYVSRGGNKLEAAVRKFKMPVSGRVFLDTGSSTGGFTHFLLKEGAKRVYAVDVGSGQMAPSVASDERVILMENTNIRKLERLPEKVDAAVIDVSFISLCKVIPHVEKFVKSKGDCIALIKPQFECGPGKVAKTVS
ncbi:MAG: TlyA family RNA methyltransferase [Fibrobacterota bacterium]